MVSRGLAFESGTYCAAIDPKPGRRALSGYGVVGDHNDGTTIAPQFIEEVQHHASAFRVEVASRFVGQNHYR
jgi:hypothetical protein